MKGKTSDSKRILPRLIIVAAPSGGGKTTLCDMLLRDFPSIKLSISTTTRKKRPYEEEGVHYHFVKREDFQKKIDQGQFAEWAEVHGNLYGTSKKTIEDFLAHGNHVLFDIDVQGAMSLKKIYKDRVLLVFIHPPSLEVLERRLRDRKGDSAASIEKRLRNAYNELEWSKKFDYQIINDELERAYKELKKVIEQECQ
jgi:guanylate kinase